jgi:hypothetical protein
MGYTEDQETYWKKKVEKVASISKKYGYPEQNVEFWKTQVAGVISLIVEIEEGEESKNEITMKMDYHLDRF